MPSLRKPTQDDAGPSLKHKSVSLRRAPTCHSTFSLLLVPNARPLVRSLLELHHERADRPGESARDKNGCAWALLTCEPADLRDPEAALPLAIEANDATDHRNPMYLDTLSLAYHLTGDIAKAVENQKKAISLLRADADRGEYEAALIVGFRVATTRRSRCFWKRSRSGSASWARSIRTR